MTEDHGQRVADEPEGGKTGLPFDPKDLIPFTPVVQDAAQIVHDLEQAGLIQGREQCREVASILESALERLHERIGEGLRSLAQYLVGAPGSMPDLMRVVRAEYEGSWGAWSVGRSGLVWLHPRSPYRLTIAGGISFEVIFEPDEKSIETPDGPVEIRDHAQIRPHPENPSVVQVFVGAQLFEKMIPLKIALNSMNPESMPSIEVLMQLNVAGAPYQGHLLRLDYATFYRELIASDD